MLHAEGKNQPGLAGTGAEHAPRLADRRVGAQGIGIYDCDTALRSALAGRPPSLETVLLLAVGCMATVPYPWPFSVDHSSLAGSIIQD